MEDLNVHPLCVLNARWFVMQATRSGGPGGQNVNKVSSKIELRFDVMNCTALADAVKARIRAAQRNRFDADGWLLVTSSKTRDQHKNLDDARQKIAEFVRAAWEPPVPRRTTKPSRGAVRRRLQSKTMQSEKKHNRKLPGADR
jgi:ribosome-associated protein